MEVGAELDVADSGDLTIDGTNGITNKGSLVVGENRAIIASSATTFRGDQPMLLAAPSATIASVDEEHVIINETAIAGEGVIEAALANNGTVKADLSGKTLLVTGPDAKVNDGVFRAQNAATLRLAGASVTGAGTYEASGGNILFSDDPIGGASVVSGGSLDVTDGGSATIDGLSTVQLNDALTVQGCSAEMAMPSAAGGCTPPRLSVVEQATLSVAGSISLEDMFAIDVVSSDDELGGVVLAGNFANRGLAPSLFNWGNGRLSLSGESPQAFEAAGTDVDATDAGFIDNYAIGTLEITAGATVSFEDAFDNDAAGQGPCSEALYVDELVLGNESGITLSNVRVYYRSLVDEGATISLVGCGELVEVEGCGDAEPPVMIDSNPCSGYIDPRQDGDGVQLVGLSEIELRFSEPVRDVGADELTASAFSVRETGDQTPPSVAGIQSSVDNDQFIVTVQLSRAITLQEWMTLEFQVEDECGNMIESQGFGSSGDMGPEVAEPDRVDIGYLPGDVDQSGETAPLDLFSLRQALVNGILPTNACNTVTLELLSDSNRDLSVTPLDLFTYRVLVNNGTEPLLIPWAGVSLSKLRP